MRECRAWSKDEEAFIEENYLSMNDVQMAAALVAVSGNVRSAGAVQHRRMILACLYDEQKSPAVKIDPAVANDRFAAAMRAAVQSGAETAVEGTFVDPTPYSPRSFRPEPMMSPCGSSAGLAADMGGR